MHYSGIANCTHWVYNEARTKERAGPTQKGENMKVLERRHLAEMPFDKWDEASWPFVHATGDEVLVQWSDGHTTWEVEYEDSPYEGR